MDFPLKNMFDAFKDEIWEGKTPSIILFDVSVVVAVEKCVALYCMNMHTHTTFIVCDFCLFLFFKFHVYPFYCCFSELGPLDPNWFETLTSKQFISEENVSDQDDLCPNQEGHFKTPFEKDAVDSQLVSTPKVLRHHRTVSPGTEDEQSFSAPPWAGAQSPYWSQESKEG